MYVWEYILVICKLYDIYETVQLMQKVGKSKKKEAVRSIIKTENQVTCGNCKPKYVTLAQEK